MPIEQRVADQWGRLQSEMKSRQLPAIDSLLAATVLTYNLRLVTRNSKDFRYYHLEIINPWEEIKLPRV